MAALFDDAFVGQHQYGTGVAYGGQAVGNGECGAPSHQPLQGLLHQVTEVISVLHGINIKGLQVECHEGIFECSTQMFMHNTAEVKAILSSLKKVKDVKEAGRR